MKPRARFSHSLSGYDSGQERRAQHRQQTTLFGHTNQTFISKPSDSPPSHGGSIFTFSAGPSLGSFAKNESSSALPSFSFSSAAVPDSSGGGFRGQSQSMDSLAGNMSKLGLRPGGKTEAASLSGAPSTGKSKPVPPSAEDGSSVESSGQISGQSSDETSAESELSSSHEDSILDHHLSLLERRPGLDELDEMMTTPIFTESARKYALSLAGTGKGAPFSQYGLLAGDLSDATGDGSSDPRLFWNIAAPSSFFICGSQGSGKSHTLSCLLENALAPNKANVLPRPLTGIVFHYDTFISDSGGSPCEAAWLSSNSDIKVRVLCPPTNIRTIQRIYQRFRRIKVEELRLNESDLNTKRMLDLMAVTTGGNLPLYLHVAQRILRDLRVIQQRTGSSFNYSAFKQYLQGENLTEAQLAPLKQRLDTLESFMVEDQAKAYDMFSTKAPTGKRAGAGAQGTSWTPQSKQLTIVDLSCPCVTPEMACSLFNICLSLFLEQNSTAVGRIVALDEAHKYMTDSQECAALTEALLATIRLQRHLGARVVISTQEPTVSPKLLDLCSVTVVHRFTSPAWLAALKKHLAGVSAGTKLLEKARRLNAGGDEEEDDKGGEAVDGAGTLTLGEADPALELFSRIVDLRVGEALLFAPGAIVGVRKREGGGGEACRLGDIKRLAHGVLKVRIRNRTTADGGRSIMAV